MMAFVKVFLPLLLAVFLFANVVVSGDDDDDEDDSGNIWKNKECTIVLAKNPKTSLYTTAIKWGRVVRAKRNDKPGKKNKWVITPVDLDGNKYFELMSVNSKTYIAPAGKKGMIAANYESYTKSKSTKTLWIIDPPKQDVPVTLKNMAKRMSVKGPKKGKKNVSLVSKTKTKWVIKCD